MNDIHLPRFNLPAPVGETPMIRTWSYTEYPPAVRCTAGNSKDVSPSNSWNDNKYGGGVSMAAPPQTGARCRTPQPSTAGLSLTPLAAFGVAALKVLAICREVDLRTGDARLDGGFGETTISVITPSL